jgi:hypothetical protein
VFINIFAKFCKDTYLKILCFKGFLANNLQDLK